MASNSSLNFTAIGAFGLESAADASHVYFRVPLDTAGELSSTGKSMLLGSTGGWKPVPGAISKGQPVTASVMIGRRLPKG